MMDKMKSAVNFEAHSVSDITFQPASLDIWSSKYRLCAKDGTVIDEAIDDTYRRVARALADVESESLREECYESFLWALRSWDSLSNVTAPGGWTSPRRLEYPNQPQAWLTVSPSW